MSGSLLCVHRTGLGGRGANCRAGTHCWCCIYNLCRPPRGGSAVTHRRAVLEGAAAAASGSRLACRQPAPMRQRSHHLSSCQCLTEEPQCLPGNGDIRDVLEACGGSIPALGLVAPQARLWRLPTLAHADDGFGVNADHESGPGSPLGPPPTYSPCNGTVGQRALRNVLGLIWRSPKCGKWAAVPTWPWPVGGTFYSVSTGLLAAHGPSGCAGHTFSSLTGLPCLAWVGASCT